MRNATPPYENLKRPTKYARYHGAANITLFLTPRAMENLRSWVQEVYTLLLSPLSDV